MRVGIAFDLKSDAAAPAHPDDLLEEYDSEETVDAIAQALRAGGHEPVSLGGGRRFLERVLGHPGVDLVFNIAEGRGGRSREAHVPAVCEILDLPYTGSDPLTLALALDKALTKRVAVAHGLPTPEWCLIDDVELLDTATLPALPLIAKLNSEGSSMGLRRSARCDSRAALDHRVRELLREYDRPVLVERFVAGEEITVGVLGTGAAARVAGAMEIASRRDARGDFVYSIEAKRNWREEIDSHVPPRATRQAIRDVERVALDVHRALGGRDVARIDFRLDDAGRPFFLEINPLPGLDPVTGDLPICWSRTGRSYTALIAAIVDSARARVPMRS